MMHSRRFRITAVALALITVLSGRAAAQRLLEVYGGAGYTAGNVNNWSGHSSLYDWSQTLYDYHAEALLVRAGGVHLGLEAGYEHLMWYEYNYCPGCSTPAYTSRSVSATRVMAVARVDSPARLFAEVAAGMQFFDGYSDPGVYAGIGYRVPLTAAVDLPIKVRAGLILDSDQNLIPLSLSAGLSYRFPARGEVARALSNIFR